MSEWAQLRLRDCVDLIGGSGFPEDLQGSATGELPFFKVSDMNSKGNERYMTLAANRVERDEARRHGWRLIPDNSVVFAKVGAALLHNRRRLLTMESLVDNNMMGAVPFSSIDPRWLHYWLQMVDFASIAQVGVLPSVNQRDIGAIPISVPPLEEQRRIAEILDTIDETIRATEGVIAKLRAVRWGLVCAEVPAPDGAAPEPVSRVADFGEVVGGRQLSPSQSRGVNPAPYLRVANVFLNRISFGDVLSMDFTERERQRFYLVPGDILLNEGQSLELVGRSAIFRGPPDTYCFQNTLVRFRTSRTRLLPEFAQLIFEQWMYRGDFQKVAMRTTSIAHLGSDRFSKMALVVPPIDRQAAAVERIDAIDLQVWAEESKAKKIRETRCGLADDLLSGRVRTVAS